MPKPIGQYSNRVRLLKMARAAKDATGQRKETWPETTGDTYLWCSFTQLSGIERIAAGAISSNIAAEVRIQGAVSGIEATDRFSFMGTVYKIDSIFFDGYDVICNCSLPLVV